MNESRRSIHSAGVQSRKSAKPKYYALKQDEVEMAVIP